MADLTTGHRGRVWRLRPGELVALDCLAAVGLAALFLLLSSAQDSAVPLPSRIAVVAAMALPVAVRRRWPVPVFGVVSVLSVLAGLFGVVHEPFLAAAFVLYWIAAMTPRSRWRPTAKIGVACVLLLLGGLLVGSATWGANSLVIYLMGLALTGMAWTIGQAVGERRSYAARSARQLAVRAVADERLRIARELHDIVAHNIGLIAVKAGVANHIIATRPQEAGDALRVIETASRAALAELRHMLGVLRSGDTVADARPAPGLSCVPDLVERARTVGLDVELRIDDVTGLPEGVERSAYRIVQEAMTNVMKHAGATRCGITLAAGQSELLIDVTDDGSAMPRSVAFEGHGLIGMRERVAMYGGDFEAGPRPEGGFRVLARIPYHPAARSGWDQS